MLAGTEYFPNFTDKILFLESYKENIKVTISKLQHLKNIGIFKKIKSMKRKKSKSKSKQKNKNKDFDINYDNNNEIIVNNDNEKEIDSNDTNN